MTRRTFIKAATAAALSACLSAPISGKAFAQAWPKETIRVIVPAPPGGTMDVIMRIISDDLQTALGQPIVIESKPGAAGMIGVGELLKSPRDGHTIMIHISGIVSEIPHIAKAPYDPFTAIQPLIDLAGSGLVFVGSPQVPANTVAEVIAHVKANADKINYASYSAGTRSHVLGIQFAQMAGLQMTHIAYRGSPPALQDLMGNSVQFMFDGPATSIPLIQDKRIKAYAVTSPERIKSIPDVPTFKELGYPQMTQLGWVGLFVTPDIPAPVQERLRAEVIKILAKPAVQARFAQLGLDTGGKRTPAELAADLKTAYDAQGAILKSVNFKPE